ncbi:MAG: hypothetical protein R3F53_05140 [Gammaproteobacteria bacterium]
MSMHPASSKGFISGKAFYFSIDQRLKNIDERLVHYCVEAGVETGAVFAAAPTEPGLAGFPQTL